MSRAWLHGMYLQDDWKVTPKLTLNLGIRWEIQRPVTDRYNRLSTFDYNAVNPVCTAAGLNYMGQVEFATSGDRGQYDTTYKHFAPAIGFAYQIMPKLVMRGGYGIFFPSQYPILLSIPGYNSDTPYVATTRCGALRRVLAQQRVFSGPVPVIGNSLGGLTNVGFGTGAVSRNARRTMTSNGCMDFNMRRRRTM